MATALVTSRPTETATMSEANDIPSRPLRITALHDSKMNQQAISNPQPSPLNSLPPPNPHFVFPARPASCSAPPSFSRATGRRPQSAIDIPGRISDFSHEIASPPSRSPALPNFSFNPSANSGSDNAGRPSRSPALPNFSFNPGATLGPDESLLSPPLSPPSPMSPNRNGHRRGGSEFVGGKLRAGGSITVMSTSPTRSESGFASPKLSPADAHPRRGHAHRRSGAISSHDLTMILKPNNSPTMRGSSAPASPADFGDNYRNFPEPSIEPPQTEPVPQQTNERVIHEVHSQPTLQSQPDPSPTAPARTRVGFSDTVEVIPRPLSLISTDTSSTMTVRPSHRVSGSISSIISGTNLAPADRDSSNLVGSNVSRTKSDSRPSTAGAVLERSPSLLVLTGDSPSPRRRNSIPLLMDLPKRNSGSPTNPSPTKTPRRWSFFRLEPFAGASSPTKARSASSSSSGTVEKKIEPADPTGESEPRPIVDGIASRSDSKRSTGRKKKQKKVKSWAGSILTRKSKSRQKSKSLRRRSQTPPTRDFEYLDDGDLEEYEAPTTPSIPAPPVVTVTEPAPSETEPVTAKPSRMSDDDIAYPMIDLDAALGPFNTPSSRDLQWEEAQKAGAPPKRQLHSAAGLRGFSGPGMHYHRRAESAPEMPPFEAARNGIHRFASSSTMADVFEEDEEDDEDMSAKTPSEASATETQDGSDDSDSTSNSEDDASSTPTQEHEPNKPSPKDTHQSLLPTSTKRKGSGSSLDIQRPGSRMRTENSSSGLYEEVIIEEPSYVTSRRDSDILGTPETPSSGAPSPRTILSYEVDPLDTSYPIPPAIPTTPYSTGYSSSFPSPRSPMSYDAHRISTAQSSINDEHNYHSLLMGEPGPELIRISVDVPSLTSSNSTMTRESSFNPGVRPRNMPFHDQRPASFSSSAFGRRRSSLVSLSRLISSAHGERSKLSMEVPLDAEPEKKPKTSKTRRFSRLMQFWKPKGSTES
ncbi:uncharacterized protein GGS22DRAFT_149803 [Annulohypoxylon maeteangense]|uniref:uncharacterized protein n=1 Tax=Annulohypoxylon maeteangense TaxID=1927788 RepID=UPI002007FB03|nr:uncharacterized protein GGS22DRAFT_149803 [Annulohypoxylon maeteangense]KAI0890020.1 hypothetical protein GGS22DRAFT_149803 [Annulohypoxylon maeteangense]